MSYKVGVRLDGDGEWVFDALRFKNEADAHAYGNLLWRRWSAVQVWEVFASDDLANVESFA